MGVSIWEGDKAERVASALEAIAQGGGGGGTDDYEELDNKPSINNVTLVGNKTLSDLGAASASDLSAKYTKPQDGIPASDLASGVIPTVHNVPAGGSAGQVLTKTSGTDYEAEWATPQVATDEQVAEAVDDWLGDNVAQETGYVLDRTLLLSNAAAPADMVGELKNAFSQGNNATFIDAFESGYINSQTDPVPLNTITPSENYVCVVVDCRPYDRFLIKGFGGNGPRLWAFSDSDGNRKSVSSGNEKLETPTIVTAPIYATKFIYNTRGEKFVVKLPPSDNLSYIPTGSTIDSVVTYNTGTKILTIPGSRFYIYKGIGRSYTDSISLDLSSILSSGACSLWMTSSGDVYATAWSGKNNNYGTDVAIGYVFQKNVFINGLNHDRIKILDTDGTRIALKAEHYGAYLCLSNLKYISYDAVNYVLTIPNGIFCVYDGKGSSISSEITVDLSGVVSSNAALLWMKEDKTIYGTVWSGYHPTNNADKLLGYVYKSFVFINGVYPSQIKVTDADTKLVYCFGDSLTAGVGATTIYHMYFHEYNNKYRLFNYGVGGTGFATEFSGTARAGNGVEGRGEQQTLTGSNTVIEVMQSVTGEMPNIIIEAGTNDYSSNVPMDDFQTAVETTLDYALTKTAHVLVLTPIKRGQDGVTHVNNIGKTLKEYCDVIINVCERRGIVYAVGYEVGLAPWNMANQQEFFDRNDYTHPNAKGQARMARHYWDYFLEAVGD